MSAVIARLRRIRSFEWTPNRVWLALFAFWPFTRLVHVWSVPVGYLARPYLVYRRRAGVRPMGRPVPEEVR